MWKIRSLSFLSFALYLAIFAALVIIGSFTNWGTGNIPEVYSLAMMIPPFVLGLIATFKNQRFGWGALAIIFSVAVNPVFVIMLVSTLYVPDQ